MARKKSRITSSKKSFWEPLQIGDVVDVIAPGFAVSEDKLKGAVDFLKNLGLEPRIPEDLFGPDVICSQSDAIRLRHLKKAWVAKDSKAIWCLRGGYGALRLIREFAKLKRPQKNKIFIGYSDATTLHHYFNQFWNFSTLHGPLLDRLGQHTLPLEQVNEVIDIIFGARSEVAFQNLRPLNRAARSRKRIHASVLGGNLAVTQTLLGTPYMKPVQGRILFFEDIGERGYKVDKMLKHLELAGFFKDVQAVVFGEFVGCEESNGESFVPRVLERFASECAFPVFSGMEVGHGSLQRVLPFLTPAFLECGDTGVLKVQTGCRPS